MLRKDSEESLSTLLTASTAPENDDSALLFSDETLTHASDPVFRQKLSSYTRLRELPLVTCTLRAELLLYGSPKALADEAPPLFSIQPNKLHFLKKLAPLLTIYRHTATGKTDFCKTYFKILSNNLTCYVLMFAEGPTLVVYNNAVKPHCDTIYKGTKLRVYGPLGAASTFGNGLVKVFLLPDSATTLADGLDESALAQAASLKDIKLQKQPGQSALYDAVVSQQRTVMLKLLQAAKPVVEVPFATFVDHGGKKVAGFKYEGTVRLFESAHGASDDFTDDLLVVAALMLTLVEQEHSKMRGNNMPSYV